MPGDRDRLETPRLVGVHTVVADRLAPGRKTTIPLEVCGSGSYGTSTVSPVQSAAEVGIAPGEVRYRPTVSRPPPKRNVSDQGVGV